MKRWIKIGVIVMLTLWVATIVGASDNDKGAPFGSTNLAAANQADNVIVAPVEKDRDRAPFDRDFDFPSNMIGVDKMNSGVGSPIEPRDFDIPDGR